MSVYLSKSPYLSNRRRRRWSVGRKAVFSRNATAYAARNARHLSNGMKSAGKMMGSFVAEGGAAMGSAIKALKDVKGGKRKIEIGPRGMMIGLGAIAIMLSLVYLAHFNQVATKGYELRRLEAHRQQLLSQYEVKNMRLAEVMALHAIANDERTEAMQRPPEMTFLRGNSALASR